MGAPRLSLLLALLLRRTVRSLEFRHAETAHAQTDCPHRGYRLAQRHEGRDSSCVRRQPDTGVVFRRVDIDPPVDIKLTP